MQSIAAVREAGGIALGYGLFINAIIAFILVAFVLWMVVRSMNKMKKEEEAPAPEPEPIMMLLSPLVNEFPAAWPNNILWSAPACIERPAPDPNTTLSESNVNAENDPDIVTT